MATNQNRRHDQNALGTRSFALTCKCNRKMESGPSNSLTQHNHVILLDTHLLTPSHQETKSEQLSSLPTCDYSSLVKIRMCFVMRYVLGQPKKSPHTHVILQDTHLIRPSHKESQSEHFRSSPFRARALRLKLVMSSPTDIMHDQSEQNRKLM